MSDEVALFLTDDTCLREAHAADNFSKLAATDIKIIEDLPPGTEMVDTLEAVKRMRADKDLNSKQEEILQEVEEMYGMRKLDEATFHDVADAAGKTFDQFYAEAEGMELSEALAIKQWRCKDRFSWRLIAAMNAGLESGGDNQIEGMALCKRAAEMFEENFMEGDWN